MLKARSVSCVRMPERTMIAGLARRNKTRPAITHKGNRRAPMTRSNYYLIALVAAIPAFGQIGPAPNVLQVVPYSQMTTLTWQNVALANPNAPPFSPTGPNGDKLQGITHAALFNVYTSNASNLSYPEIDNPKNYQFANRNPIVSVLSASIATSLSLIPLSSPTSGVILKKDPLTGAELPASATLGPIFTQRAETVGKGNWYIGVTYQDYHFTSFNGASLNGLP